MTQDRQILRRSGVCILYVFVVLTHSTATAAVSNEFSGSGTVRFRIFGNNERDTMYDVYSDFKLSVADCLWSIRLEETKRLRGNQEVPVSADYSFVTTDETNVFWIQSVENLKRVHPDSVNSFNAQVTWGSAPDRIDPIFTVLWYAFASASFFDAVTNDFLPTLAGFSGKEFYGKDLRTKAYWSRDSKSGLPTMIAFCDLYWFAHESTEKLADLLTNSLFESLSFTNVEPLRCPNHVRLTTFAEIPSDTGAKRIRRGLMEVELISLSPLASNPILPPPRLPPESMVSDLRFYTSNPPLPIVYFEKTGNWRDISALLPIYKPQARRASAHPFHSDTTKRAEAAERSDTHSHFNTTVRLVVLVICLAQLTYFVVKRVKRKE
jgi:hypothetical protein